MRAYAAQSCGMDRLRPTLYCNPLLPESYFAPIRGIIFDCDGVLIDSKQANLAFYNRLRHAVGLPSMSKAEEEYVHSHTVAQSLAHILPPEAQDHVAELRSQIRYKDLVPYISIQPELIPFLEFLASRGIRMAVNTNRTDTMGLILQLFDLERFFFPVMTSSQVSWSKPHPESMYRILNDWRLGAKDVVYIGDSEVDARTAHAASVPFWAYQDPTLPADMYVPDFGCLRQVMALNLS
ncbi:HAD family hydrolase [Desulfohalobium retbaense]|uniref:phosphoglycolate phosphatase n=1 Tax=Desulfohalobium retbaense (strain ATCC 49708 / DSM 5692 / JCM 16813 / HR100) TaxID=485915 RepID=C8X3F3_DESRD|nr:HAD-IA family hydrolase [Desulfohalobium retbaense]ACV68950.1 HAD-superfamily hydrolase, subfamily IA, variant 1 [Desulfohalobium retbaense DSM 5692]